MKEPSARSTVVFLVCGGSKRTRTAAIATAVRYWQDSQQRSQPGNENAPSPLAAMKWPRAKAFAKTQYWQRSPSTRSSPMVIKTK